MNLSVNGESQVPPGFRFHPTEEELLHYYLRKKVAAEKIDLDVITDVDLNKLEPWDIQEMCKIGSGPQNDWYFFSHKDKKYPTGSRTNRATAAGFWKATGRDKVIYSNGKRIGMRKTLVFYKGRAPHGKKSDWIMHEYRLDETSRNPSGSSLAGETLTGEEGWVVCRVFKKKNYHKALESPRLAGFDKVHPGNDVVVLDQILTYMGKSSIQNGTKNSNNGSKNKKLLMNGHDGSKEFTGAIPSARFLHLPGLETQSPMEIISPHHVSSNISPFLSPPLFEDLLTETEPVEELKLAAGPTGWAALDRMVASQLNGGQVEASSKSCAAAGELSDSLYFPVADHRPFGSGNDDCNYHSFQVNVNGVDFWNYTHSSSSPSDPLSHLSV
ncbi:unnamed protein product [Cuscuta europaea]|uniref:NAC domain-containing protein n=1 Tax=Cuscuta europaea TaxID=41803 RepID=A0A9P0ZNI1_CUSEU|nr:unnamed protein product [Cuscuta europaea]